MGEWSDGAECKGVDTNNFFDAYESDPAIAQNVDRLCREYCPIAKMCFAVGVSHKEWGVWGGVYLKDGVVDKEFNQHKSKQDWNETWESLTMDTI